MRAKATPFRPPNGPAELERLWQLAEPLPVASLPNWLEPPDAGYYRRVVGVAHENLTPDTILALEDVGLIVDPTGVYVADPTQPIWSIAVYRGESLLDLAPVDPQPILSRELVTDVEASYVADPFLLFVDEIWHLFFEVFNWRENKGEIGLAVSDDLCRWQYQGIVLAEPFHLSYPCVFERNGAHYLVPESHQAGEIRLYLADPFPTSWTPQATLVRGSYLADPSPFVHDERWWLFAGTRTSRDHDTLRLFHSDRLEGPWSEHPSSPIVVGDPRSARPGGRVVSDGGSLVRLAQDCSRAYGESVLGFEITKLTATSYAERPLSDAPVLTGSGSGWNRGGMHHLDAHRDGGCWVCAVDGWTDMFAG